MVSALDPAATVARLASLVRQLASEAAGPGGRTDLRQHPDEDITRPSAKPDLAATLAARIRAAGHDPASLRRRASRLLIETLLTSELAPALAADPAFQTLVDDVLAAMDSSAQLRADLDRLVERVVGLDADRE